MTEPGWPMLLWLTFALLAAAVATLLMRTLRNDRQPSATEDPDASVYREQLAELDADVERGVVTGSEAASARAEIARRLLRYAGAADPAADPRSAASKSASGGILVAAAATIPIACIALYLAVGSPGLPGRPLAQRLAAAPETASTDDLIARVEARLRDQPDDGMGWSVIAPVYLAKGRIVEAGRAYERAIALLGETPERLAGLAKALVLANNGVVVEPARQAYERLVVLDPNRAEAKFWLAIYEEQNGRPEAAASAYRKMLADAPSDAPWRSAVETQLAALTGNQAPPVPKAPDVPKAPPSGSAPGMSPPVLSSALGPGKAAGAGPTPAEFVAAAERLPPQMREQMLGRMIERASEAVKSAPKDVAAWSRIVTGYKALGKAAEAATALKQAREALAGDGAANAEFDALAASLGLPS